MTDLSPEPFEAGTWQRTLHDFTTEHVGPLSPDSRPEDVYRVASALTSLVGQLVDHNAGDADKVMAITDWAASAYETLVLRALGFDPSDDEMGNLQEEGAELANQFMQQRGE